jgi:hypothetical protein
LSENSRFRIFGLWASSIRDGEVQFRTTKQTKFEPDEKCSKESMSENGASAFRRNFTDIGDIIFSTNFCPKFREVDVVGIVVSVAEKSSSAPDARSSRRPNFETVYICDTMFNYAAVLFWGGVSECGFDRSMLLPEMSNKTPNRSI